MRTSLLTLVFFAGLTTVSMAQAPQAASPNAVPEKATADTTRAPAMRLGIKKTATAIVNPDTYKGRVLTVGSGGGIVGKERAYLLFDDGRLFRRGSAQAGYTLIGKQTATNTKKVFRSVEDRCAIRKTTYNRPGNLYRFVGWKKGSEQHKVTWAPGDRGLPAGYEQVYTRFIAMIPPVNR